VGYPVPDAALWRRDRVVEIEGVAHLHDLSAERARLADGLGEQD
jgi:hypothetical protein